MIKMLKLLLQEGIPVNNFIWFSLGWGNAEVVLMPLEMCSECRPIKIMPQAGDIGKDTIICLQLHLLSFR
jgi:hypothetical protein